MKDYSNPYVRLAHLKELNEKMNKEYTEISNSMFSLKQSLELVQAKSRLLGLEISSLTQSLESTDKGIRTKLQEESK